MLDWNPQFVVEDAIEKTIEWYKAYYWSAEIVNGGRSQLLNLPGERVLVHYDFFAIRRALNGDIYCLLDNVAMILGHG